MAVGVLCGVVVVLWGVDAALCGVGVVLGVLCGVEAVVILWGVVATLGDLPPRCGVAALLL